MSKRLQVVFDDDEFRALQRSAQRARMTVSAWVRQALRDLQRREPEGDVEMKLRAVREATRHAYAAPEIDQMLEETERGYLGR